MKAYTLFESDVEYVVQDDRVLIVDEFTGRTLPYNRYQHGLHAALESKEGVRVQPELETLLRWAHADRDRSMLVGAEVEIVVR